mmetsp:Transcript_12472/g.10728  ORF Transcript_12472/g.10728 Transcript_12472/m.10728 type:complete len:150 (-) Transcript_12472:222-671(-)
MIKGKVIEITKEGIKNLNSEYNSNNLFCFKKQNSKKGLLNFFSTTLTRYGFFYQNYFIILEKKKGDQYVIKSKNELTRLFQVFVEKGKEKHVNLLFINKFYDPLQPPKQKVYQFQNPALFVDQLEKYITKNDGLFNVKAVESFKKMSFQ